MTTFGVIGICSVLVCLLQNWLTEWLVGICARQRSNFLLLRQKKVTKEKASRIRRPAAPVRCVARFGRGGTARNARAAGVFGCFGCWEVGIFEFPAVEAGLSSAATGGSGLALSERSEFSQTPPGASSARNRAAALTSARLLFAYFLLAKQEKVSRPPGRDPAYRQNLSLIHI